MLASRRREYSSKVEQVTVNHSVKVRFLLFPQKCENRRSTIDSRNDENSNDYEVISN